MANGRTTSKDFQEFILAKPSNKHIVNLLSNADTVWTYVPQLLGYASKTNIENAKRSQKKKCFEPLSMHRGSSGRSVFHRDLRVPTLKKEIKILAQKQKQ